MPNRRGIRMVRSLVLEAVSSKYTLLESLYTKPVLKIQSLNTVLLTGFASIISRTWAASNMRQIKFSARTPNHDILYPRLRQ